MKQMPGGQKLDGLECPIRAITDSICFKEPSDCTGQRIISPATLRISRQGIRMTQMFPTDISRTFSSGGTRTLSLERIDRISSSDLLNSPPSAERTCTASMREMSAVDSLARSLSTLSISSALQMDALPPVESLFSAWQQTAPTRRSLPPSRMHATMSSPRSTLLLRSMKMRSTSVSSFKTLPPAMRRVRPMRRNQRLGTFLAHRDSTYPLVSVPSLRGEGSLMMGTPFGRL